MQSFGEALVCARRLRQLSQMALSHLADVSARHLSFLETGRARPSLNMVLRLALALRLGEEETVVLVNAAGFVAQGRMAPQPASFGARSADALAVLFAIEGATDFEEAVTLAARALAYIGLPQFFIGSMSPGGADPVTSIKHRYLGHAPLGWLFHYRERGFGATDPLIRSTASQHLPFFWSDVTTPRVMADPLVNTMFSEATEFGITDGFVASVRRPDGKIHAISCMGRGICPSDPVTRSIARSIATAILHKADESAIPEGTLPTRFGSRQRSILTHVLNGASSHAIADSLRVSAGELRLELTRLCAAFGTSDAMDAALRARRYGLLPN
jgi:transcriptional regulator with XRE-family HTH domain